MFLILVASSNLHEYKMKKKCLLTFCKLSLFVLIKTQMRNLAFFSSATTAPFTIVLYFID